MFRASISTDVSSCAPSQTLAFPAIPQATTDDAAVSQLRKMTQLPQMYQNRFAAAGDYVVIAAGVPFGHSGTTNLLRIAKVGANGADDGLSPRR